MVTSNHIHFLVRDTGSEVIARSMHLIAGRTAQQYNQRKRRQGAFWEDRHHAPAIEANEHLHRCVVYIDLNMVRAGVVKHPGEWDHGGYGEIQRSRRRYGIINLRELSALCGFRQVEEFQQSHRQWVEEALTREKSIREDRWSGAVAVGSLAFVERVQNELGYKTMYRKVVEIEEAYALRESKEAYGGDFGRENNALSQNNGVIWDQNHEGTKA